MTRPSMQETFARFRPGVQLGSSGWLTVSQQMIDRFGDATLDHDPMHVDPDWAAAGPFGRTVAFGFLTMSLLTRLFIHDVLGADSSRHDAHDGHYLNYGFDRLRLIAPVPSGSRIRAHFEVLEVRPDDGQRTIVKFGVHVECDQADRPVLVAEWLACWVPPVAA
ncbi:MAG: MaoC family dehydratase [Steroidobacteraceae bacterium]|jgi:acyl dehydratase|nr:MaoC family dehydratase [Steroidobacteraceae bacterium]